MTTLRPHATEAAGHLAGEPVVTVRHLEKHFPIREGALQRVAGHVKAVDGISFEVRRGETLGLVGESGCGKTTLGRCVSGLTEPTAGAVYFRLPDETRDRLDRLLSVPGASRTREESRRLEEIERAYRVDRMTGDAWRRYRRNCQVVFQDAFSSLNPRQLVKDIVARPLRVYHEASGRLLTQRVIQLLESVGLGRQHLYRYPHQFSGGQRQRISIARALALDPEFIVLDEPTSALDVSVQAQILNLLHELQQQRGLTYLFISHDLGVVRHMSDRIVVMYVGEAVEAGRAEDVFMSPRHPYTEALLAANPDLAGDPDAEMRGLEGTVPDPARPPRGCRFHTRCPVATPICGWEIDDAVAWLIEGSAMPDALEAVERSSDFEAELAFGDEQAAASFAGSLMGPSVPAPMRLAMVEVSQSGRSVHIRFEEADSVTLEEVDDGHLTSCVLHTSARRRLPGAR